MDSLPVFLKLSGKPVILVGDGDAAAAKRRLIERAGGIVADESATARIAIVAVEDAHEAAAAAERLRARGILVNVTDRPDLCDFTMPAIVDRSPVLIAIGTGGASAGLAKALRQRIEALLPASLGTLAQALFAARGAIRARWPDPADRRRAIDAAIDGPLDPLSTGSHDRVEAWLASPTGTAAGRLVTIGLRSADPDDLTLGEARLLGQADRIYHRADAPAAILDRARADAVRLCAASPASLEPGLSINLEQP
jgi:uroporphyrin-III C-methyltransferase/precorrin-2 dehydrogenase/sirohydrochlorin ferrochelatase